MILLVSDHDDVLILESTWIAVDCFRQAAAVELIWCW